MRIKRKWRTAKLITVQKVYIQENKRIRKVICIFFFFKYEYMASA